MARHHKNAYFVADEALEGLAVVRCREVKLELRGGPEHDVALSAALIELPVHVGPVLEVRVVHVDGRGHLVLLLLLVDQLLLLLLLLLELLRINVDRLLLDWLELLCRLLVHNDLLLLLLQGLKLLLLLLKLLLLLLLELLLLSLRVPSPAFGRWGSNLGLRWRGLNDLSHLMDLLLRHLMELEPK